MRRRHIREPETAGHDALLYHRGATGGGFGQRRVESLRAVGLDADVVQTRPGVSQEVTIDILSTDGCYQLQLHVPEVAQRNSRDEISGLPVVAAAVRSKVDVGNPY